ncbi:MAG TPA: zinc ABC transporter substrate-binding protein [Rhizomicrobium sp.]|nr:zinc ABC transporter substrate-binding protein [Rhizomicrobium sp.]
MHPSARIALATALFLGLSALAGAHASPVVLATIKPVHSLVAAVMKGVGTSELLIQGAQSEHSYALKPSDAGKIGRARIVFEVGPDLETYLVRPLATLASKAEIVALEHAPGVHLLPARRGGLWEDGADPDEGPTDPHIWLDPENAIAITRSIAAALGRIDPVHAPAYAANSSREIVEIAAEESRLRVALAPVRGRPYLVFHDAYRYFEHRFGLAPVGAVTVAPERPVGPRRIERLRADILNGKIACVFREPQFSPRLIDTLVEGSPAKTGILDPLGAALAPGPDLYQKLLRALSDSLTSCLR